MNSKASLCSAIAILGLTALLCACGCSKTRKDGQQPSDTTQITPPGTFVKTDVMLWLTKADSTIRFKRQNVALNFSTSGTANNTIVVDSTQTFQTMDGFGFALTGGSAYLINRLPAADRTNILRELFSSDSTFI